MHAVQADGSFARLATLCERVAETVNTAARRRGV
jgi:hypothetical protein